MANIALVNYWVRLLKKEQMKMEDVPDEIREDVQRALNGEDVTSSNDEQHIVYKEEEYSSLLGAKSISSKTSLIDSEEFSVSGVCKIGYLITEIFDNDVMPQDEEYPQNINFELIRIEDTYGKFESTPSVKVVYDKDYCLLTVDITSKPVIDFKSGDGIMRLDLKITSSNYEDMKMTIYVVAK